VSALLPSFDWVMGFAGGTFIGWLAWGRPFKKFRKDVEEKATEMLRILDKKKP
jgi:hypothetical protein